jgi:hypothetical protein
MPPDLARYSRQILFTGIGEEGQRRLLASRVLVCGCGALGTVVAVAFQRTLRREEGRWDDGASHGGSIKTLAVVTFLVWIAVIFLGRLIAYDHVWGSWSPAPRL